MSSRVHLAGTTAKEGQNTKPGNGGWPRLPIEIAFVTGMLDMMGWFLLSKFFSANITGDAVEAASYLVPGQKPLPLQILAVPLFFVVSVLVYFLSRRLGSQSRNLVRSMRLIQFLMLACLLTVSLILPQSASPDGIGYVVVGVLAILTVAVSNTAMHMLDTKAPTTWAITSNCVTAMIALMNVAIHYGLEAERAEDLKRWNAIWPAVLGFLAGGLAATLAVIFLHRWAWAVPTTVSFLILVTTWREVPKSPN